jgi:transposase InsO family protein
MMMAFIDAHRKELGIEPICRELAIAPSSYHEHAARLVDPGKRSVRARRDDEIKEQIKRVHQDSFGLYGTRKVWHQMRREGAKVAKCTVERLMRAMELAGVRRGKKTISIIPLNNATSRRDTVCNKAIPRNTLYRAGPALCHDPTRHIGAACLRARQPDNTVRTPSLTSIAPNQGVIGTPFCMRAI